MISNSGKAFKALMINPIVIFTIEKAK